ncbi:MAG: signal peptidase I [Kiritimatiellae bacterium]|nr:signal peptidase I [Kiritimatiellia bacterium]
MKKTLQDFAKEWLDTLVVAISVAMAFRAYFYEPFNIPTGSMQPTLWGYHTQEGGEKGAWDAWPLSWAKWLWSGESFVEYKAPVSGQIRLRDRNDGFYDVAVGSSPASFQLPADACRQLYKKQVKKGETIWRGKVISGDFIFVNRWLWNFRRPRDGEVMIFATTGINGLMQGTHYIKRMKATPGETYELEHLPKDAQGRVRDDIEKRVTMGEDEYFACGDNFDNSFDSRYWGAVPGKNLRGTGSIVFWPFKGWRKIQ